MSTPQLTITSPRNSQTTQASVTTSPARIKSTISTSIASTTTGRVNDEVPPVFIFPEAHAEQHDDELIRQRNEGAFNYYFLFLALFGVSIAVGLWWIQRRRKQRKERTRQNGNIALARDLEGWVNTRRWFQGTSRHNQSASLVRREEGLDEHGEAPPPYQPKNEVIVTLGDHTETQNGPNSVAVPLRAVTRDANEPGRPPDYSILQPETVNTRSILPGGAESSAQSPSR